MVDKKKKKILYEQKKKENTHTFYKILIVIVLLYTILDIDTYIIWNIYCKNSLWNRYEIKKKKFLL